MKVKIKEEERKREGREREKAKEEKKICSWIKFLWKWDSFRHERGFLLEIKRGRERETFSLFPSSFHCSILF